MKLVRIWEEIFELPRVGVTDDFFDLGGHSILAAQMIVRLEKEFGVKINLSTLLVDRTVEQIAKKLGSSQIEDNRSNIFPLRMTGTKLPLFCIHGGGGHLLDYRDMVSVLPEDQPVYGLRASDTNGARQPESVEQLADRYLQEIQMIQKHGPYRLCGMSFGGLVAYQIAVRLAQKGEPVGLVAF